MKDDFDSFGKGTTGYVHYMESFHRNNNSDGKKPRGKGGCLSTLLLMILVVLIINML